MTTIYTHPDGWHQPGEVSFIQPPNNLTINSLDHKPLVTIHPDGSMTFGPNYTPSEAAMIFWNAVKHYFPFRGNNELAQRLRAAAKRYDNPDYEPTIRLHDLLIEAADALSRQP